ncbi:MAG: tetratricopeptide repeat protein [Pirellulales bacterium]|nr:tetratricopeptide repeat protein [Pirellulales bacterium]
MFRLQFLRCMMLAWLASAAFFCGDLGRLCAAPAPEVAQDADDQESLPNLVSQRLELVAKLRMQQSSGDTEAETLPTAVALHAVEVRLIALAARSQDIDREELAALRNMHVDLLSWLGDAFEKTNLNAALAARQGAVEQLEMLNGKDHWTTRTAAFHVQRVELMQKLSPEDLQAVRAAAARQLEGTRLAGGGELQDALAAQAYALDVRARCFGADYWLTARSMNEVALVASQLGDLANAEKLYRQAIAIYLKWLGPDHPALAMFLANLADVMRQRAVLDEADIFQQEAIRLFAILDEGRGPQSAQAINHLSMIRLEQGELQQALDLARQAEQVLDELDGRGGAAAMQVQAMVASNLSSIEHKQGDLGAAESQAEDAIEMTEEIFGPEHPHVAQLRNNLGHIQMERGEFETAQQEFAKALAVYRQHGLTAHINVASVLINQGDLHRHLGHPDEARTSLLEAVTVLRKAVGEAHPDHATVLNLLALVETDQGNWDQAAEYLAQAVAITRASLGEQHPRYLTVLENSIELANAQRRRSEIKQLVQQAASVALEVFGEQHPEYAEHLSRLGQLAADAEEYGLAESLLLAGTELLESELGEKHPKYAEAASRLGRVYVATEQAERGEALLREGLNVLGETLGEQHPKYAETLRSLGDAYSVLQNVNDAESSLQAAVDVLASKFGKKHPEYGLAVRELAELYLAKGDVPRSRDLITESADILAGAWGRQHPEYADTLRTMADVYSALHEPDLASQLRANADAILQELVNEQIRTGQQRLWQEINRQR